MTWTALVSPVLGFLKALIVPVMAWIGGKRAAQADYNESLNERIHKAAEAARRAAIDPEYVDELRGKYRGRRD